MKRGLLTQGDTVTSALFCCLCNFCLCGAKSNKLKVLQVQINSYRFIEPPLTSLSNVTVTEWKVQKKSSNDSFPWGQIVQSSGFWCKPTTCLWFSGAAVSSCPSCTLQKNDSGMSGFHKCQEDNDLEAQNGAKSKFTTKYDKGPQTSEYESMKDRNVFWIYLFFIM